MNRYLRPAIGIVAAAAVAAGALFVGVRFAAPETITTPATTIQVPVIAPVGTGPDLPTEGSFSPVLGVDTVTAAGTTPTELPPDLAAALEGIAGAADPAEAIVAFTETGAPEADGDPCSPVEGDPPADCPDGLHSAVFALEGVRDLFVAAMAFPPTQEEYEATSTYTLHPWCPATTHDSTEVPFGFFSTTPADYFVTYWPNDSPGERKTATISTSTADRDAYSAQQAAHVDMYDLPLQRSCLTLTDIDASHALYTASYYATDYLGRTSEPRQVLFNSSSGLVKPQPGVASFGSNIVEAWLHHTPEERVVIHGTVASATTPEPRCDDPWTESSLISDIDNGGLTEEDTVRLNLLPEYTENHVSAFLVPEGATFVICIRVFPAGEGVPSWETARPVSEARYVVQTPDVVRPVITVDRVALSAGAALGISAGTHEGIPCGDAAELTVGGHDYQPVICEPSRVSDTAGIPGFIRDVGYDGRIVIATNYRPSTGAATASSTELTLGVQACTAVCPTPADQWYRLDLDGPGPSTDEVVLHVTWEQGLSNGASDWSIPYSTLGDPDFVPPVEPDYDHSASRDNFQINWEAKNVSFTYDLAVDRPVDYTVEVASALPALPACVDAPSPVMTLSGHTESTTPLRFSGLCLGEVYYLRVTLTDDAGTSVVYGNGWGITHYTNESINAPGWDGSLVWEVETTGPAHSKLYNFTFGVGGESLLPDVGRTICSEDGAISYSGTTDLTLGQNVLIVVGGYWTVPETWSPSDCGGSGRSADAGRSQIWETVTLDQVQWGSSAQGVWLSASDLHSTRVHVWMDDFR